MGGIFASVLSVIAFVALILLLVSHQKQEKENYLVEGMCLGIILSVGLRSLLDMDLGLALSVGMLLGALIGQQVPKKKETNHPNGENQTTAQTGNKEGNHEKH